MELRSFSTDQTVAIARGLARRLSPGDVIGLEGDLGTGKTVMARGIARELGYPGPVQSPTFTIIRGYPAIGFCHIDAYRLEGGQDLIEAGFEEYLDGTWICAVEWADRVRGVLPGSALRVNIEFADGEDARTITFEAKGEWQHRLTDFGERLDR